MAAQRTTVPGRGYGSAYVDSLIWGGTAWDPAGGPITYAFGRPAAYEAARAVHGASAYLWSAQDAQAWSAAEIGTFKDVLALYAKVSGLTFAPASSTAAADIVWWKTPLWGAYGVHEVPSPGQIWGYFNSDASDSWSNLRVGGDGRNTIIHEIGHAMGLAHPHDGGVEAGATAFPGVSASDDTGRYGLNQGIFTVMSYNTGWDRRDHDLSFGAQGGLGAFDIAALQALYGANVKTARGNNVYSLPNHDAPGTGWSTIWDAGGNDTIRAFHASDGVTIDLRAATLRDGNAHAGGYVSSEDGVAGGFTIAKGVVIENALGGSHDDSLYGNAANNRLRGIGGDDVLRGFSGNDRLEGGIGNDTLVGGAGRDVFQFDTQPNAAGNSDRIADFHLGEDRIRLDDRVFAGLRPGPLPDGAFWTGPGAHDGTDRIVYDGRTGLLFYDPDGSGAEPAAAFAVLSKKVALTAKDLFVV